MESPLFRLANYRPNFFEILILKDKINKNKFKKITIKNSKN